MGDDFTISMRLATPREAICQADRVGLQSPQEPGLPDIVGSQVEPLRAQVKLMSHGHLRAWRTSRSSIVSGWDGPPRHTFRFIDIERGWLVRDSDHTTIGSVVSSGEDFLTVSRGLLSSKLYVPLTAVGEVHEGVVTLNVSAEWVQAHGWDRAGRREQQ